MPSSETYPASGTNTIASAQVLNRRLLRLREVIGPWSPGGGGPDPVERAGSVRSVTATPVNNLPCVFINLYLIPEVTVGGVTILARNNISWRPVFRMPTAVTGFGGTPYSTGGWVPFTAPMIIPVGLPITYKCSCNGVELVGIEIQTDLSSEGQIASIGAREDLVVSISASQ